MRSLVLHSFVLLFAFTLFACGTTSKVAEPSAPAPSQTVEVNDNGAVVGDAVTEDQVADEQADADAPAGAAAAENAADGNTNDAAEQDDATPDEPADIGDLVRCEAKIAFEGQEFTAEAIGPTLEEARDNAFEESCAQPCADKLPESAQESEREDLLDACIEDCVGASKPIAAQCWQHSVSIYTEGAWSPTNDAPPTNGAENF